MNGDGIPDIAVGGHWQNFGIDEGRGSVWVFSGADGSVLFRNIGQPNDSLGSAIAPAGDWNGDGHGDLLVAAPNADSGGGVSEGVVYVYSGYDGSELYRFNGEVAGDHFGSAIANAGDVDGDGVADFVIGAPGANSGAGAAYVFSGATHQLIFRFDGSDPNGQVGFAVAGAGDASGDGLADVIVGAPGAGKAYLLSIADRPSDLEGPRVNPSATQPIGSVPGPVDHIDLTFSEPINPSTFTADDIDSFTGPDRLPIDTIGDPVPFAGTNDTTFRISFSSQSSPGEYDLTIGPNIRDQATGLAGGVGNLMDQNANGRKGEDPADRYTARFTIGTPKPIDRDGPRVVSSSLSGTVVGPGSLTLTFNEAIDASTFTTADINFTGPNGPITTLVGPTATDNSNESFRVVFDPQSFPGNYTFTVGPDIRDLAGNAMDQNLNGQKGEANTAPAGDQFTTGFNVPQPQVVTVITHGYEPDDGYNPQSDWPGSMRDALTSTRGLTRDDVLVTDWAAESNNPRGGWAEAAGDKLFAQTMQKIDSATTPIQLQFIGHSRGAVVDSEAIERLAYYEGKLPALRASIGSLQETTLDPDPSKLTNLNNDPDVKVWNNVTWADNYYETTGIPPFYGVAVPGAFNVDLTVKLDSTLLRVNHSEVHDWYHWTIDTQHDPARNYAGVGSPLDDNWYSNLQLDLGSDGVQTLDGSDNWQQVGYNWSFAGSGFGGIDFPAQMNQPGGNETPQDFKGNEIFNGDFFHNATSTAPGLATMPGWESNDSTFNAGSIFVSNPVARLTKPRNSNPVFLRHNLSFVPPDATGLKFDAARLTLTKQGTLSVLFATPDQCQQSTGTGLLSLGQVTMASLNFNRMKTVQPINFAGKLDLSHGGQVGCFVFQLEGSPKLLRVQVDNIQLQRASGAVGSFVQSRDSADNTIIAFGLPVSASPQESSRVDRSLPELSPVKPHLIPPTAGADEKFGLPSGTAQNSHKPEHRMFSDPLANAIDELLTSRLELYSFLV